MKATVTMTVDLGDPADWTRSAHQGGRWRRVPDRRPLDEVLEGRLNAAVGGVEEYAFVVDEARIEVIDE